LIKLDRIITLEGEYRYDLVLRCGMVRELSEICKWCRDSCLLLEFTSCGFLVAFSELDMERAR